jgi:hypothetical protein
MDNGMFGSSTPGTPAVYAQGTNGADGIDATSDAGYALSAVMNGGGLDLLPPVAVYVSCDAGLGLGMHVVGGGATASDVLPVGVAGIFAEGGPGSGVYATSNGGDDASALYAADSTGAAGVTATSDTGIAVSANSQNGIGVQAEGKAVGVFAKANDIGVWAVAGEASSQFVAVLAEGGAGTAVAGASGSGTGVQASSQGGTGLYASTENGTAVTADGGSAGVALQVIGKVAVQGNSAGTVTMPAGAKTLTVSSAAATPDSLIFLTLLDNPQEFLWIGTRKAGSFTINAGKALPAKITIMFLIIN